MNYDAYMQLTIDYANSTLFTGFAGTLDSQGKATATINVPANLDPSWVGVTLHHAVIPLDRRGHSVFASNPVSLTILK